MKEIKVDIIISNVQEHLTDQNVMSKLIHFVESNGWCLGGTIREVTEEDIDDTII